MLKKILYIGVPVVLATVAYLIYRKINDNDSPIVVTDTTTILKGTKLIAPSTTICHYKGFGSNHNNNHTVHDTDSDGSDNFRPAWLVLPSGPVPILSDAKSFHIKYTDSNNNSGTLLTWSTETTRCNDQDDITAGDGFTTVTNTTISKGVYVKSLEWKIDDGPFTSETPNGKTLVTVNYCPHGKCKSKGKKPCKAV